MKKLLGIVVLGLLLSNPAFAGKKFKDIKGFKKQYLSTPVGKVNRIIEVKKIDGYPVYEGDTSIQVTVNREDAGCDEGNSKNKWCDGKGNRSRQEISLGKMKLKNKE